MGINENSKNILISHDITYEGKLERKRKKRKMKKKQRELIGPLTRKPKWEEY